MPAGDRTGPMGAGAMSGRAAGFCAGFGMAGFSNSAPRRRYGMGYGRCCSGRGGGFGFGRRHRFIGGGQSEWVRRGGFDGPYGNPAFQPQPDPEFEKQALKNRAEALQSELDSVRQRLAGMESFGEGEAPGGKK